MSTPRAGGAVILLCASLPVIALFPLTVSSLRQGIHRRRRVGTRIPPSSSKGHGPEGCSRLPATITDDGGQKSLEAVVAEDAIPGRGPRMERNARYIICIYIHKWQVCGQRGNVLNDSLYLMTHALIAIAL